MGIFEEFEARKIAGEKLSLDDLVEEDLRTMFIEEHVSDSMLSQLFNVKKSKITYRRRKQGITIRNSILDDYLFVKSEHAKELNKKVKAELLVDENLTMIAKALTHFAFRNGPIEDMHANPNNQLSDSDMKTLNKFMVNRIAYIFKLIIEKRWIELDFLIRQIDRWYGHGWDAAIPDDGDTRKIIELMLKK
ncbi:hypothetical protein NQ117_16605 [Paenibacillus sp. SC116]|uniref:hypothetical protein n=1 Tax=Paenibacillus sp. SC116 TaxID=2968986 RepID=UPI00215B2ECA|nr:hypothetical protein [Paenibacillus sp. SC116]MCR8845307.1 hypothetical protein [Paenibacillus sp. SC116]